MRFFLVSANSVIVDVPNGTDINEWASRITPGQTLRLASGGSYTLGAGVNGFSTLPTGTVAEPITVDGNGATITGGASGVNLGSGKQYITFANLNLRDQTSVCVQTSGASHITFQDCTFKSTVNPGGFIDVVKVRNSSYIDFTRCHIYESLGVATCDGFEFWNGDNCTCTDCTATGLKNGADALDNGHGFEAYGEGAGDTCTNVQFIRCAADDCRVGFSVEDPSTGAAHTVTLTDCTSSNMTQYDYYCEGDGTMTIVNCDGGTKGGDGTFIDDC